MNTRGLTELVILSVGLSLGVLSDRTFAMMVVMALVTTFMAAPILNWIMPRKEMVRVLAGGDPARVARRILVAAAILTTLCRWSTRKLSDVVPAVRLLLVRLIPTPRALDSRSGLRDEEIVTDDLSKRWSGLRNRSFEERSRRVRFRFYRTTWTGPGVCGGDAKLRSHPARRHRPSLERHVVRALVHRVFTLAACDAIVFVDRRGLGIRPDEGPVTVVVDPGEDDARLRKMAQSFAASLR